jgi:hypothetical protein
MAIRKTHPTVFTPLEDGTAVLLDLTTLVYYSLNRSAAVAWQEIDKKDSVELADLTNLICERFDSTREAAASDLSVFLEKLAAYKVVTVE